MTFDRIVALLGKSASDDDVAAALRDYGIVRRPELDELDEDEERDEFFDFLPSSRNGIEFGFEHPGHFFGAADAASEQPLLLRQIYLYLRHDGMAQYAGELPFGITAADDRTVVRRKLANLVGVRRFYRRDVWDVPECSVIIAYELGSEMISSILCTLRQPPLPQPPGQPPLPSIDEIVGLFGEVWYADRFRRAFGPLGVEQHGADIARRRTADLHDTSGVELSFVGADRVTPPMKEKGVLFAAAKFYRDHDLGSRGWKGELPFGMSFEDSQVTAIAKVGLPPDRQADSDLSGYALWHGPQYSLHVHYSNLENLIFRVTIMQPGYWKAIDV